MNTTAPRASALAHKGFEAGVGQLLVQTCANTYDPLSPSVVMQLSPARPPRASRGPASGHGSHRRRIRSGRERAISAMPSLTARAAWIPISGGTA